LLLPYFAEVASSGAAQCSPPWSKRRTDAFPLGSFPSVSLIPNRRRASSDENSRSTLISVNWPGYSCQRPCRQSPGTERPPISKTGARKPCLAARSADPLPAKHEIPFQRSCYAGKSLRPRARILVHGVKAFEKSVFGPCTLRRTWGTRPEPRPQLRDEIRRSWQASLDKTN
jgi:hypothetical protein